MRHEDHPGQLPTIEVLESRRLMSTSVFLGGECLPGSSPTAPPPTPTPTTPQNPGHSNGHGNGHDHNGDGIDDHDEDEHDDNGGGDSGGDDGGDGDDGGNENPGPTPPPIDVVIPQVVGTWSGSHATPDQAVKGNLSLNVSQSTTGDLAGSLDFVGSQRIRWSGQLLYDRQTGRLTMYYLSSTLVAKMSATLSVANGAPTLQGTVEYFTREGSYKSSFSMLHTVTAIPRA